MKRYDEDIRVVEARLQRERELLRAEAEDLRAITLDAAVSPKGLLAAAAVGFFIGELLRPRRQRHPEPSAAKKMGFGGLIASLAFAALRSQVGSPWTLGRAAWEYAAKARRTPGYRPSSYAHVDTASASARKRSADPVH